MQFGAPVVLSSTHVDGSLRQSATKKKVPMLLYEAGEALRFDDYSIKLGVQGILNTMSALEMLPDYETKTKTMRERPFLAHSSFWMRAPGSGIFSAFARLGDRVEKNEVLGVLSDPLEKNNIEVLAKKSGLIIGKVQIPLVNKGDPLYHIATLQDSSRSSEKKEQLYQTEEDIDRNYI
jgi:predicted deacylase